MSDFKAKMHKIRLPPQTKLGAYNSTPDLLAVFKGLTSKGRVEKEGRGSDDDDDDDYLNTETFPWRFFSQQTN